MFNAYRSLYASQIRQILGTQGSRQREHATAGFTLTELLVAMVITAITSGFVISLLTTMLRAERDYATRSIAFQDLNRTLDLISDEIRSGQNFQDPPSCPISVPTCIPVMQMPLGDPVLEPNNAIFYYLVNEADGTARIERFGPRFRTSSRVGGIYVTDSYDTVTAPSAAQVISPLPQGTPVTCPNGNPSGTDIFNICVTGRVASINLQAADGSVVSSQTSLRSTP